jgi:hypothetical protein
MTHITHQLVEQKLSPLKTPFTIPYDGTSQTKLSNTGRFGFYIERQFKIGPNNDRAADTEYAEFKSVNIKNTFTITPISIGTIPEHEYNRLSSHFPHVSFLNSDPFKKMERTLYVFYRKEGWSDNPTYKVESWVHIDMTTLDDLTKQILENDYWQCVQTMTKHSYRRLSYHTSQNPSTRYLQLSYKGDGYYNYPCWKFSSEFMKKMYAIGKSSR